MIKITCTSCHKPLSLDETKLPMKEVSFPCPVCKQKLTVDRRTLGQPAAAGAAAAVSSAPASVPSQHITSHDDEDAHTDDHQDDFGSKAFIVGADSPALRQAAKLVGYLPVY